MERINTLCGPNEECLVIESKGI